MITEGCMNSSHEMQHESFRLESIYRSRWSESNGHGTRGAQGLSRIYRTPTKPGRCILDPLLGAPGYPRFVIDRKRNSRLGYAKLFCDILQAYTLWLRRRILSFHIRLDSTHTLPPLRYQLTVSLL